MRKNAPHRSSSGFTLVELMVVVAIIGLLTSVAIPLFSSYQLRSKSTEVKASLGAIRVVEESVFGATGAYLGAAAEPPVIPGTVAGTFDGVGSDFAALGWSPQGKVYFSYAIEIPADAGGYTADAGADIDGDGIIQLWGYAKPDAGGVIVNGGMGCNGAALAPEVMSSCLADSSIY